MTLPFDKRTYISILLNAGFEEKDINILHLQHVMTTFENWTQYWEHYEKIIEPKVRISYDQYKSKYEFESKLKSLLNE